MSDPLASSVCARVKDEPLWDLNLEPPGPIEDVIKIKRDSEASCDIKGFSEDQILHIGNVVKAERSESDYEPSMDLYNNHEAKDKLTHLKPGDSGIIVKTEEIEEDNEALWSCDGNQKVKKHAKSILGGFGDTVVKVEDCDREECEKPDVLSLFNNHKVKEDLVLGPEEFQQPKVTLKCRGGLTSNLNCSVRLEQMQVDMKSRTCSIGRNTYKFGQLFLNYEDLIDDSSTRIKIERQPQHPKTAHPGKFTKKIIRKDKKPYKCRHCSDLFKNKKKLLNHENTHGDTPQYMCPYCDYISSSQSDVGAHLMKHNGSYLFECSVCPYFTNYKNNFKRHVLIHGVNGKKGFMCDQCDYSSNNSRHFLYHRRSHNSGYTLIKKR
ncbi:zinc finger protein 271-like isoform X3 [Leguminivora glycinivorella]|uniref:zinc finger protein 271-like isoform X3 n=1 Tax=Leguminivora glycinivorella TaxID=1035111 RepID=UPI00200D077B|nr:zinc finger protein 271-like isoform X3 [Leguminivora glycinivorella]